MVYEEVREGSVEQGGKPVSESACLPTAATTVVSREYGRQCCRFVQKECACPDSNWGYHSHNVRY